MGQGRIDECVEHIANAVSVCGQPQQLLNVLQQTLPPPVFSLLIERLPTTGQVRLDYYSFVLLTFTYFVYNFVWFNLAK